ncbi:MAG TPA: hypothetical protein VFH95_01265 [Candidatus Kapabacteria bacterium]|nr:hypothetical protein [Candidatus Kapabacteria bacterium]
MLNRLLSPRIFVSCIALLCGSSIASAHWVKLSPDLIGRGPYSNQGAMASTGGIAWAGMYNLYKSTDLGLTWKSVLSTGSNAINDISFYDDSTGVVSTLGGGLYRTTDQGATWLPLEMEFLFTRTRRRANSLFGIRMRNPHGLSCTMRSAEASGRQEWARHRRAPSISDRSLRNRTLSFVR